MPACKLVEAMAMALRPRREANLGDELAGVQRSAEQAAAELRHAYDALAARAGNLYFRVERRRHGWQLGRGIKVRQAAAQRAAVAGLAVADQPDRLRHERQAARNEGRSLDVALSRQGADHDRIGVF